MKHWFLFSSNEFRSDYFKTYSQSHGVDEIYSRSQQDSTSFAVKRNNKTSNKFNGNTICKIHVNVSACNGQKVHPDLKCRQVPELFTHKK